MHEHSTAEDIPAIEDTPPADEVTLPTNFRLAETLDARDSSAAESQVNLLEAAVRDHPEAVGQLIEWRQSQLADASPAESFDHSRLNGLYQDIAMAIKRTLFHTDNGRHLLLEPTTAHAAAGSRSYQRQVLEATHDPKKSPEQRSRELAVARIAVAARVSGATPSYSRKPD